MNCTRSYMNKTTDQLDPGVIERVEVMTSLSTSLAAIFTSTPTPLSLTDQYLLFHTPLVPSKLLSPPALAD